MAQFPDFVRIVEVGARDGLQNEAAVSTQDKVALINGLADAGLKDIEAGAFRYFDSPGDHNHLRRIGIRPTKTLTT